ncbi:MAG TPA: hypothetical protein VHZ24_00210 [Pirellulales bacterium]|jgi:hypothetical protein|nr:hypothetical protein [Pirellulales bacterium]
MASIDEIRGEIESFFVALGQIPASYLPDAIKPLRRFAPQRGNSVRVTFRARSPEDPKKSRQIRSDADESYFDQATCSIVISYESAAESCTADVKISQTAAAPAPVDGGNIQSDLIVALEKAERDPRFREFVALKKFRDEYLPQLGYVWAQARDACGDALADAIEQQIILKGSVFNPRLPHPTTTIRLNREHPAVNEVLRVRAAERSAFRPVQIQGPPLSQTILSERR